MPLDPAIITRDVHVELLDNEGNPRAGTVTFRNSRMTNGEQLIPEDDVVATLNVSGEATVTLIANVNNPEISPNGSYYRVTEQLDHGFTHTRFIQVDGALPEPIEYAGILDATPLPVGSTFVTQAQLVQAVEDAVSALGLDPDLFAKLVGADPITGTFVWEMPIVGTAVDPTGQLASIIINNDNDVHPTLSPDLFLINYKGVRARWDNEWGGIRIDVPSQANLGYADVGMKIFEQPEGNANAFEIFLPGDGSTPSIRARNGIWYSKGLTTSVGPQTFAGDTTMAGTLAVTGQVTVPAIPVGDNSATAKAWVEDLVAGGGVPTSRLINTTAPLSGGGDLTLDRTIALDNDGVTNALLANMAQSTIKGRAAGAGTGDPTDLTLAQVFAILGLDYTNWVALSGFTAPFSAYAGDVNGGAPQIRIVNWFGTLFAFTSGRIAMSAGATSDQDICDIPTSLTWQGAGGTVSAVPAARRQWPTGSDGAGGQRLRATAAGKFQIVGSLASSTVLYLDSGFYRLDA